MRFIAYCTWGSAKMSRVAALTYIGKLSILRNMLKIKVQIELHLLRDGDFADFSAFADFL